MLSSVSAVESANAIAERALTARRQEVPTLADKTREASMALDRTKRDLAAAQLRAERQERLIADARRELEQLRWLNTSEDSDPETARLAAATLVAQNAIIDAAMKEGADTSAQIVRLQSRIERQTTRFFDLQNRTREDEATEDRTIGAPHEPERDKARPRAEPAERDGRQAHSGPAPETRDQTRREERLDIRDFAALARRAWSRLAAKPGPTAPG